MGVTITIKEQIGCFNHRVVALVAIMSGLWEVSFQIRDKLQENLRWVFRCLQQYGLRVKLSKCQFFQDELEFLGHTISQEGVRPTKGWTIYWLQGVLHPPFYTRLFACTKRYCHSLQMYIYCAWLLCLLHCCCWPWHASPTCKKIFVSQISIN